MARQYRYDSSNQALYRPAEAPAFFDDWLPADAQHLEFLCAEMSRLAYAPENTVRDALPRVGFRLDRWFGGPALADRLASRGTEGFVARRPADGRTVIAFRGTEAQKPEDLLSDLLTGTVEWPGRGRVHLGFARAFDAIRPALVAEPRNDRTVVITGHSLGAAVATLAAAALQAKAPTLITFGSPRVGDLAFVGSLGHGITVTRFVDCCDVVARIPPAKFDDAAEIGTLIENLTNLTALSKGVATVVASVLGRVGFQPEFTHLGAATYIDAGGVHRGRVEDPAISQDQDRARKAYAAARGASPGHRPLIADLADRWAAISHPFDALRDTLVGAFDHMIGHTVPVRDLADHAPINYVSSFPGRLP